jgi:hypothetical protein
MASMDRHASQFNIARVASLQISPIRSAEIRGVKSYLLNLLFADDLSKRTVSTKNAKPMNQFAMLARVVIDETDGSVTDSRLLSSSRNSNSPASPAP